MDEVQIFKATKEPPKVDSNTVGASRSSGRFDTRIGEAGLGKAPKEPPPTPSVTD